MPFKLLLEEIVKLFYKEPTIKIRNCQREDD